MPSAHLQHRLSVATQLRPVDAPIVEDLEGLCDQRQAYALLAHLRCAEADGDLQLAGRRNRVHDARLDAVLLMDDRADHR